MQEFAKPRGIPVGGNGGCERGPRSSRSPAHLRLVLGFHCAALWRLDVAPHGSDVIERAIDGTRVIGVFRLEFTFEELRHV